MKKLVSLLLTIFCLFSISGCTMVRIDTTDIDNIVSIVLSKENSLYNHIGKGYKYYIPRGVTYIDTIEFNDKLYSDGNYYYLYIEYFLLSMHKYYYYHYLNFHYFFQFFHSY